LEASLVLVFLTGHNNLHQSSKLRKSLDDLIRNQRDFNRIIVYRA